jgi:ankyrin repeat protein
LNSLLTATEPDRDQNFLTLGRIVLLTCIAACALAPRTVSAQSKPDSAADPLYGPIEQIQADAKWRVYAAVITHDHKTLQALLDGGDSPNRFSPYYRSPLVMACQIGDLDSVKILLGGGAKIDLFDNVAPNRLSQDETALTKAIDTNHIEIVRYLLAQGAQVNLRGPLKGETPLFAAAHSRNKDILTVLIQAHADLNVRNNDGYTVLALASKYNDLEMVEFLEARGAKSDSPKDELLFAASHGDVAGIQRILSNASPAGTPGNPDGKVNLVNASSKDGFTPLMAAASQGQTAAVRELIAAGADVNRLNSSHDTALMLAITNGHRSTVLTLLDAGADPKILDAGPSTTLYRAATFMDDPDIVLRLIGAGVSVDSIGFERDGRPNTFTPLMIAASYGRIHTARILLDAHVDVNARRFGGSTALMDAAAHGETDIIALLLRAGADPSLKDSKGQTAEDYATGGFANGASQKDVIAALRSKYPPPSNAPAPLKR